MHFTSPKMTNSDDTNNKVCRLCPKNQENRAAQPLIWIKSGLD